MRASAAEVFIHERGAKVSTLRAGTFNPTSVSFSVNPL